MVTRVQRWGPLVQAVAVIPGPGAILGSCPVDRAARPGTTSRVGVLRDGGCPLSWWGAGGLGLSVPRLEPLTLGRAFMSPATCEGGRSRPAHRGRVRRHTLELLHTPAADPGARRARGMRLGHALGGARSPTVPGRVSHFTVQALRGWPRRVEPGRRPGHPSSLPHVARVSQSFVTVRRRRVSGLVLDVAILGQVPDPHLAALCGLSLRLSPLPLPTPHLLLEGHICAVEKGHSSLPIVPFVPKLPTEGAFGVEIPLELLSENRIPVGLSDGILFPPRSSLRPLTSGSTGLGLWGGLSERRDGRLSCAPRARLGS